MLLFTFAAFQMTAQNLNPQVQVTNDYQSTAPDIRKQDVPVSIPDSVLHFDYTFDYSVFDSPYKGAFEFSPYVIGFVPDKMTAEYGKLYLKAGAGYTTYPVFDVVYSPNPRGNFSMSVVQKLDGYVGSYFTVAPSMGLYSTEWNGHNINEKFAVEGRWGLRKAELVWATGYEGIFFKDWMQDGRMHSGGVSLRLCSNDTDSKSFSYDVNVAGKFSSDIVSHEFSVPSLYETDIRVFGSVGPVLDKSYRVLVDYDFRYNRMDGSYDGRYIAGGAITPHVVLDAGPFDIDAGARVDYFGSISFAPDVKISAGLFKDDVTVFLGARGGQKPLGYTDFKHWNHYFTPAYTEDFQTVVNEKIAAFGGLEGHVGAHFNWSAEAGFSMVENSPLEKVGIVSESILPGVGFYDYNLLEAVLRAAWKSESFVLDGEVTYRKMLDLNDNSAITLPALSADVRALYSYRDRLKLGASAEFESARHFYDGVSESKTIPMWIDLGAYAEFSFNSWFSVWARGGNLLNFFVRRDPFHVERGINGTAGISFVF